MFLFGATANAQMILKYDITDANTQILYALICRDYTSKSFPSGTHVNIDWLLLHPTCRNMTLIEFISGATETKQY